MDAELRIKKELNKQKRKDRFEAVKRWEEKMKYENELQRQKFEQEQAFKNKLKVEKQELELYKMQLKEAMRFKREIILQSMDDLKQKNKSELIHPPKWKMQSPIEFSKKIQESVIEGKHKRGDSAENHLRINYGPGNDIRVPHSIRKLKIIDPMKYSTIDRESTGISSVTSLPPIRKGGL